VALRLPVVSLWMPWAFWIPRRWKRIETRTHDRFKSLVGKRIAIHAAMKWDKDAIDLASPYLSDEQIVQSRKFLKIGGAIICTAMVTDGRWLTAEDSPLALIDCGETKRHGLFLDDVQVLEEAIAMPGKQGIWYAEIPMEAE
jgi:hypothetical protein